MNLIQLKPRKALNKAFLKVKANRDEIEVFKANLIKLIDTINESESEEFHKNLISDFLKNTYYGANHYINTKGRNDLVIHNGNKATDTVGVIVEAKSPTNKAEMLKTDNINTKAFQELVLYYLRERITHKNLEIKHLLASNIYEWFIFDANVFEKEFAQNKNLVKQFIDFEEGRLSGKTTDFFYTQIAQQAIEAIKDEIVFTYFDIRDYDKPLRNADKKDDTVLIALYKLLSPEHLLKLPFANDSNSLDKTFYAELLHIIGLTETKDGGKKLIQRKKEGERNQGSLLESAIFQLENLDKITRLNKPQQFGDTYQERLFNVALELAITWVNRILFLKLLEAQLLKYNKGDKSFSFLNLEKIESFDDLNSLFFSVLARKPQDRSEEVKKMFANVPYLNSSLFEPTEIEHSCLFISQLKDGKLPLLPATVIKNNTGQKLSGELVTIQYIFEFLNAYDFASEGSEEIQEDNKRLINASVLGLIFEKINGYKDGSFFTPGFITMYMCRETIRRAVVQKFNEAKGWNCADTAAVYDKIEDRKEANTIINSLKICDPAVGSGHFLVSALNEIIAIKSELKVLIDRDGLRLKEYFVVVENDELVVTDDEGKLFAYNPKSKESQRVQETLFHEKQTIIENCLFGVDINPNSVKICRLRLWIELLKNAYYKAPDYTELETLPNIDINIKCGNSLISRYALDADIKKALRASKWTIDSYRIAVSTYRNAQTKEEKRDMERLITQIKTDFESEVAINDKRLLKLNKAKGDLFALTTQVTLFERTKVEKAAWDKQVKSLSDTITQLETELEEIKGNKIYDNAFEWRFEFPEVLNDDGEFMGFDVVIGNPPYGVSIQGQERDYLTTELGKVPDFEIYYWFINKANFILRKYGQFSYIIPNTILFNLFAKNYRLSMFDIWHFEEILDCTDFNIFTDATVRNIILMLKKDENGESIIYRNTKDSLCFEDLIDKQINRIEKSVIEINNQNWGLLFKLSPEILSITFKMRQNSINLSQLFPEVSQGLIAYDKYQGQSEEIIKNRVYHSFEKSETHNKLWLYGGDINKYCVNWNGKEYINYCAGIANPREQKYFIGKRILIREITNPSIFGAITEDEFYNDPAIIIIKENENNIMQLECLIGILNSKLATFYHFNSSPKATKGAFPKILVYDINNFPLPENTDKEIENNIVELVNKIQSLKQNDKTIDTTSLEAEIDQLVYQLYGLSAGEIRIVEGNN